MGEVTIEIPDAAINTLEKTRDEPIRVIAKELLLDELLAEVGELSTETEPSTEEVDVEAVLAKRGSLGWEELADAVYIDDSELEKRLDELQRRGRIKYSAQEGGIN